MKYAICEECGLVVEAEVTHNGLCPCGLYFHCGWSHDCPVYELFDSKHEALEVAAKLARQQINSTIKGDNLS